MSQQHGRSYSSEFSTKSGLRARVPAVRPLSFVVVESGSCWPDGFERSNGGSDCLVMAEQFDELPIDFAERVIQRVRALRAAGTAISKVTFAAGRDCRADRRRARSMIARAVFDSCILTTNGSIDFVAHDGLDEEARHELLAFAGTLLEQVGYNPPAINVKFAAVTSPASGVRQAVPARDGETLDNVA